MAKKWKVGVKYQFKNKEGFLGANAVNASIVDLIGDSIFSIVELCEGGFSTILIDGTKLTIPQRAGISRNERKFFKVFRERFVAGASYILTDRKGFSKAHHDNEEITKLIDARVFLIDRITDSAAIVTKDAFYLPHKEIKFFQRIDN